MFQIGNKVTVNDEDNIFTGTINYVSPSTVVVMLDNGDEVSCTPDQIQYLAPAEDEKVEIPADFIVPDSLDAVMTVRDYRKNAQAAAAKAHEFIDKALHFSIGRTGLTEEQKIECLREFADALIEVEKHAAEAGGYLASALDMVEKDDEG